MPASGETRRTQYFRIGSFTCLLSANQRSSCRVLNAILLPRKETNHEHFYTRSTPQKGRPFILSWSWSIRRRNCALLPKQLAPYAIPILLLGLISHAVGIPQKHGLEQRGEVVRVWWAEALYWLCWLALVGLLLLIVVRQF